MCMCLCICLSFRILLQATVLKFSQMIKDIVGSAQTLFGDPKLKVKVITEVKVKKCKGSKISWNA